MTDLKLLPVTVLAVARFMPAQVKRCKTTGLRRSSLNISDLGVLFEYHVTR
jgi:hypothetical protein